MGMKTFACGMAGLALWLGACQGDDPNPVTPSADAGTSPSDAGSSGGHDGGAIEGGVVDERCPTCAVGCNDDAVCKRALPTTAARGELPAGTAKLVLDVGPVEIDVATGAITANGSEVRAAGPDTISKIGFVTKAQNDNPYPLAIFTVGALTIAPNVEVRIKGTSALVIVSGGDITIAGTLSVRPDCDAVAPPFGTLPPSLPALNGGSESYEGTQSEQPLCPGGGGGGNATVGGEGSAATNVARTTKTAAGGGAAASVLDTPVLFYGGNGGTGGSKGGFGIGGSGGGKGGGALELVASGLLQVSGLVDAGGCGGRTGGEPTSGSCKGGSGGGAGGTILLEAAEVRVTGRILANGGGGAGGSNGAAAPASGGHASTTSGEPAPGGLSAVADLTCPSGGNGSPGPLDPSGPCATTDATNRGGAAAGGGGAAGQIVVRTLPSRVDVTAPGVISPAPALGALVTD